MHPIGLYIHIPFCVKKCNYCDFFSIKSTEAEMDLYTENLINSINDWSKRLNGRCVDTVYFGGGTPSVMGTSRINRILSVVTKCFNVTENVEITIEVNPNSTDKLDFSSLRHNGINRISMGLQTSNNEELRLLGRSHTKADASYTIDRIHSSGISNISLDVMLGIPLQTFDSLSGTLDFCINSGATHISTYMLKIEENTPFYKNKDKYTFADDDMQADLYEHTCKQLSSVDFRHYEISNFCKGDYVSRHNMKYWLLDDYVGIGPSAHSLLDGKRYYYPRSFQQFYNNNLIFESEGHTVEEYIMLSLRTDKGFDFSKFKELFNLSPSDKFINEARNLEKLGLVYLDENSVSLTEKGYLVSNAIIMRFLNTEI